MDPERSSERLSPLHVILVVLAAILIAPFILMAIMMPMMGMGGGMWTDSGGWMSPLWVVGMMLAFLVVALGIGYALYHVLTWTDIRSRDPAFEELRVAYAQGELSREEFEQRKDVLEETDQ